MKLVAWLILFLGACAVITGAKVVWNSFHDSEDDPHEVYSHSLSEARRSGILVTVLRVSPVKRSLDESHFSVSEAWVEKCAVHRYSMLWFHRRVPAGGFVVVLKLATQVDARFALWPPDRKASFTWIGGRYFVRFFEAVPEFPIVLVGGTSKDLSEIVTLEKPNQSLEPTTLLGTSAAEQPLVPSRVVAHL